nr:MAG TPA: hypothetical protein [Caudoviricetes sp.]
MSRVRRTLRPAGCRRIHRPRHFRPVGGQAGFPPND